MLLILVPVANILTAVGMLIDSKALSHIVDKLAFVQVSAGVVQLSAAVVVVTLPEPFVHSSVGPPHDTVALFDVLAVFLEHLARVDCAPLALIIGEDLHVVDI